MCTKSMMMPKQIIAPFLHYLAKFLEVQIQKRCPASLLRQTQPHRPIKSCLNDNKTLDKQAVGLMMD